MAKYSIDSSTLTALGDAVRVHSPEKDGPNYLGPIGVLKSPNAIDANNYNSAVFNSSTRNKFQASKKALNDVAKIKVKLNYKTYASKPGFQDYEFQMRVYDVAYITPYPLMEQGIVPTLILDLSDDEIKNVEFEINSNEITLALVPYKTPFTSGGEFSFPMFFYAEIEYLDKNNNHIDYYDIIKVKNTMTPQMMIDTINNLMTIPEEGLVITGDCQYRFANQGWDWFITDNLTTSNISNASYMFQNSYIKEIPFELNLTNTASFNDIFCGMPYLEYAPQLNITFTSHKGFDGMFLGCNRLKEVPNWLGDLLEINYNISANNTNFQPWGDMFYNCRSLRLIPEKVMKYIANPNMSGYYYGVAYSRPFQACSCLDELINIHCDNYNFTSNQFTYFFDSLTRVKDITFATNEDGTPVIVPWKSQTLDMTNYVGYANGPAVILNYNSGITADKQVSDDTTYQALKDDPDYFTLKPEYSRYTHASAVRTIASLPDCSATGTNTIKFKGTSGSLTDEGAINTLTEEEIAVATAKGWTISFT